MLLLISHVENHNRIILTFLIQALNSFSSCRNMVPLLILRSTFRFVSPLNFPHFLPLFFSLQGNYRTQYCFSNFFVLFLTLASLKNIIMPYHPLDRRVDTLAWITDFRLRMLFNHWSEFSGKIEKRAFSLTPPFGSLQQANPYIGYNELMNCELYILLKSQRNFSIGIYSFCIYCFYLDIK